MSRPRPNDDSAYAGLAPSSSKFGDDGAAPPRAKKARRLGANKLSIHQLTVPSSVKSILALARHTTAHPPADPSDVLSTVLRRAARWAAAVAPSHALADFVHEAQLLGGNRALRAHLANVRLAAGRGAYDPVDDPEPAAPDRLAARTKDAGAGAGADEGGFGRDESDEDSDKGIDKVFPRETAGDGDGERTYPTRKGRSAGGENRPKAKPPASTSIPADAPPDDDDLLMQAAAEAAAASAPGPGAATDQDYPDDDYDDDVLEMLHNIEDTVQPTQPPRPPQPLPQPQPPAVASKPMAELPPEVAERIERKRQEALERRRKTLERSAVSGTRNAGDSKVVAAHETAKQNPQAKGDDEGATNEKKSDAGVVAADNSQTDGKRTSQEDSVAAGEGQEPDGDHRNTGPSEIESATMDEEKLRELVSVDPEGAKEAGKGSEAPGQSGEPEVNQSESQLEGREKSGTTEKQTTLTTPSTDSPNVERKGDHANEDEEKSETNGEESPTGNAEVPRVLEAKQIMKDLGKDGAAQDEDSIDKKDDSETTGKTVDEQKESEDAGEIEESAASTSS